MHINDVNQTVEIVKTGGYIKCIHICTDCTYITCGHGKPCNDKRAEIIKLKCDESVTISFIIRIKIYHTFMAGANSASAIFRKEKHMQ